MKLNKNPIIPNIPAGSTPEMINWMKGMQEIVKNISHESFSDLSDAMANVPIGVIACFGGVQAPTGWLMCEGQAVSRSTYADLYAIIGTTYGVGDGALTFNIPDTRGIFVKGAGTSPAARQTAAGGQFTGVLGTFENDKMQGHIHKIPTGANYYGVGVAHRSDTSYYLEYNSGAPISDGTNGTPRIGTSTQPACLPLNFIIKI